MIGPYPSKMSSKECMLRVGQGDLSLAKLSVLYLDRFAKDPEPFGSGEFFRT